MDQVQKTRAMNGKVVLMRLGEINWYPCMSGYLSPDPIEIGKKVWVGSRTSREGYETTEVVSVINTIDIPDAVHFKTRSGSLYLVVSLDNHIAACKKHVGENAKLRETN